MSPIRLQVRELREAKGWTQEQLAEAAGTRIATISRMENNLTGRVDLDLLERIAMALGVAPGFLLVHEPATRKRGRS